MRTTVGNLRVQYSKRGIPSYEIEIEHLGLHKHKVIRDRNAQVAQHKAHVEAAGWDETWQKRSEIEATKLDHQRSIEFAAKRTQEAIAAHEELRKILYRTLEVDDAIDWMSLRRLDTFPQPQPRKTQIAKPQLWRYQGEPLPSDEVFVPQLGFFDKLFGRTQKKIEAAELQFRNAHDAWKEQVEYINRQNHLMEEKYEQDIESSEKDFREELANWEKDRDEFLRQQDKYNKEIESLQRSYLEKSKTGIEDYCRLVMSNSVYPSDLPRHVELSFDDTTGVLAVDYLLPSLDHIPTLCEVKYLSTKKDFSEKHLTEAQLTRLYDDVIYQCSLRTIHELFESDVADILTLVVFNGWVTALNKATGHSETNCIVSLQASKQEFLKINLSAIEPKICFKQLKGVAAAKLATMTAIAPLIRINREDSRFVPSHEVARNLDSGINLAAMDWQDFEHLIRELFEKEFSANGGEVKVTQASRDGGVDAVAFDPDPIRGGKIVIQAKRYTNTVGVSAVRDLYGTVMNEGATKGILVTTTDYGPDAYEFARNKPLTLMNGGNLLFLLRKHGHEARINVREARDYFASQSE